MEKRCEDKLLLFPSSGCFSSIVIRLPVPGKGLFYDDEFAVRRDRWINKMFE